MISGSVSEYVAQEFRFFHGIIIRREHFRGLIRGKMIRYMEDRFIRYISGFDARFRKIIISVTCVITIFSAYCSSPVQTQPNIFDPGPSTTSELVDEIYVHPRQITPNSDGSKDVANIEWKILTALTGIRCIICRTLDNMYFCTLMDEVSPPFADHLKWDGTDNSGTLGSCGDYTCFIIAEQGDDRQVLEGSVTILNDEGDIPIF